MNYLTKGEGIQRHKVNYLTKGEDIHSHKMNYLSSGEGSHGHGCVSIKNKTSWKVLQGPLQKGAPMTSFASFYVTYIYSLERRYYCTYQYTEPMFSVPTLMFETEKKRSDL